VIKTDKEMRRKNREPCSKE